MAIRIRGAREHNLRAVDLDLPRERLIVFCGPSGSGKSSLAFDTLHAESQRRFVEALSGPVRARLGSTRKPAFDQITGLTPSIGLAQRAHASAHPRSTVATLVEVHDLLRVLYARTGRPHCPRCGADISPRTVDSVLHELAALPERTRLIVCAPVARARAGSVGPLLAELARQGFARARIDREQVALDEAPSVDARAPHDVDVVIDRIVWGADKRERLHEAVGLALSAGMGAALVEVDGADRLYTTQARCIPCGVTLPALEPRSFSFNAPVGACAACDGLGTTQRIDPERLVLDAQRSLAEGALDGWTPAARRVALLELARRGVDVDAPWSALPWEHRELALHGDREPSGAEPTGGGRTLEGAVRAAERRMPEHLVDTSVCVSCVGTRLNEAARSVRVAGVGIHEVLARSVADIRAWVASLPDDAVTAPLAEELGRRLSVLLRTGLGYLTLDRSAPTLSGGELQRVRLAAQIGNQLSGVLYVLDEPTAGLHPRDTAALVEVLRDLRDAGNTVLVVEHDPAVVAAADLVVDVGPGAGAQGGTVVFQGAPDALLRSDGPTGAWLSGRRSIASAPPSSPSGALQLVGARGHNLRDLTVRFPLGQLVGVTGVSGSGKSSLVDDTLARALGGRRDALPHDALHGRERVSRVVRVDQSPLGRSARSSPATATKVWDTVRQLLARTPEAKARGFGPDRFSLATPGGRCEACEGEGVRRVEMLLLPDVSVACEVCAGRRFDEGTLGVTWRGHSAAELLDMPVARARELFAGIPAIAGTLAIMDALGLGYLPLGQGADTLSGGEAQRVKLARELGRPGEVAGTLYLLDEPTVGLHPQDVDLLVGALRGLVSRGGSVIAVEHDPLFVGACAYVVELGPGAGPEGGRIVREGRA
jgi:excinuclease ABC subunit A